MQKHEVIVALDDEGERLDKFLSHACGLTRTVAQQLIAQGHVQVNGVLSAKSLKLCEGDSLVIHIPLPQETEILAEDIKLDVVYEDDCLLVVNKPKGMVVHPAPGHFQGTLVNALMWHCAGELSGIGGEIRPGIVHRIDKDTSGLIVVAKTDTAHQGLAAQFAAHSIERIYNAMAYGRFKENSGEVDLPIGRNKVDRKKMAVHGIKAKTAVTHYSVLAQYNGFAHLALQLQTGRTHQIRVHMAALGHPIAGDEVYGPKKIIRNLHGQCLHAKTLGFTHPKTGEFMHFSSELPKYFITFLQGLENKQ